MTSELEIDEHGARRAQYLKAMRSVPGAVAIIASSDGDEMTGLAATAWNSLCADPPMILACVNQSASAHAVIKRAQAFSVNLVPSADREVVAIFSAQRGLNGRDRFVEGGWTMGPAGQPLLNSAVLALECKLAAEHVYGTHSIFIGEVGAIAHNSELETLLYLNGTYATGLAIAD